jgi:amidase
MKLPLLMNITLDDIAHGFDDDHFTSVHLVKAYIARINEVNDEFHAVLEINKDALKIAQGLDEERKRCGRRG